MFGSQKLLILSKILRTPKSMCLWSYHYCYLLRNVKNIYFKITLVNSCKEIIFLNEKQHDRKWHFTFFANLFNVWRRDSQMLSSASVFILLPLLFLPKVYGEKSSSHKYVVQRGRSILIAYLNNCVYSMILHPKSIDESFLKITCHVESENIQ